MLLIIGIALAILHFLIPLAYYWHAKNKWLPLPWNIRADDSFQPKVSIIIPTYNESKNIIEKLNNIYAQEYPKDNVEVIVVDSASVDGTPELVEKWAETHRDLRVILIREEERSGMVPALNYALKTYEPEGEVIVFTDADARWNNSTLKETMKYFADPTIGALSTSVTYYDPRWGEDVYRSFYNIVRIAESKKHSTPVHSAVFIAFRKNLLYEIGLLPEYTGNNDCAPATLIAFMGYRAVQLDNIVAYEGLRGNPLRRKIRRAQHITLHFLATKRYALKKRIYRKTGDFEIIWKMEWYLHIVNPWILACSFMLILLDIVLTYSLFSMTVLALAIPLLALRTFRVWILQQLYLVLGMIRNLWTKNIIWHE